LIDFFEGGYTALMISVARNYTECVEVLLQAHAKPAVPKNVSQSSTLMHTLARTTNPNLKIFQMLIDSGADLNETDVIFHAFPFSMTLEPCFVVNGSC
jgi:hypothetical protein